MLHHYLRTPPFLDLLQLLGNALELGDLEEGLLPFVGDDPSELHALDLEEAPAGVDLRAHHVRPQVLRLVGAQLAFGVRADHQQIEMAVAVVDLMRLVVVGAVGVGAAADERQPHHLYTTGLLALGLLHLLLLLEVGQVLPLDPQSLHVYGQTVIVLDVILDEGGGGLERAAAPAEQRDLGVEDGEVQLVGDLDLQLVDVGVRRADHLHGLGRVLDLSLIHI